MARLIVDVAWTVRGPFTSAGSESAAGVDTPFHRDPSGALNVDKGQVKGKMREAAVLLCEAGVKPRSYVADWFGVGDIDEPRSGRVFFSDMRPVAHDARDWKRSDLDERELFDGREMRKASGPLLVPEHLHRLTFCEPGAGGAARNDRITSTAVDPSGTAAEHTLRIIESQPRGLELRWVARIEAQAPCVEQLEELAAFLRACAARVESFGALKGSGYGIVRDVDFAARISEAKKAPAQAAGPIGAGAPTDLLHVDLVLFPLEPVYVLDRKIPGSHFLSGPGWITGAVIKGALAAALNREAGLSPSAPISADHPAAKAYPQLTRHFGAVRCLHALPLPESWEAQSLPRPHPVPLSAFAASKRPYRVWDAALEWRDDEPASGVAVASFAPDCGGLSGFVVEPGDAGGSLQAYVCAKGTEVRTAIDQDTLTAKAEQLFGYDYIAEARRDGSGGAVRQALATAFDLPDDGAGLGAALLEEIGRLLADARLGKTGAAAAWRGWEPKVAPLEERLGAYGDDPVVLLLSTDTMLPLDSSRVHGMSDMTPLYDDAWRRVWGHCAHGADSASGMPEQLGVAEVFARQALRGGWVGRHGGSYSVFHMTLAGSVFVTGLSASLALGDKDVLAYLHGLERRGVPMVNEDLTPFSCPYFPENGFGEVLVCPPWHADRRAWV